MRLPRIPRLPHPEYSAYAVLYIDRSGRTVARGIFSEATPTLLPGTFRTKCIARMRSQRSYGRASAALQKLLGWPESHQRFVDLTT